MCSGGNAVLCIMASRDPSSGATSLTGLVFGLASGIAWGVADFLGGLSSRRMNAAAVAVIAETLGLLLAAVAIAVWRPTLPPLQDLGLGALAGVAGGLGVWAFYRALAVGAMSLVAPISALGAGVPVAVGLLQGERPGTVALTGAAVALTGAVGASRAPGQVSRRGLGLAALAAVAFGTFFVLIEPAANTSVLWAALATRVSSVPILLLICLGQGATLRIGTGLGWFIIGAGALDIAATVAFAAATQHGDLSIVSVLAGLYPVATVILAQRVLRERLSPGQAIGVALALVGVGMIAAG